MGIIAQSMTMLAFLICILCYSSVASGGEVEGMVTIRVNTFRRNDLLRTFLNHYKMCPLIKEIQVVWSDQENHPPLEWMDSYEPNKLLFEIHKENSLNNRFRPLLNVTTDAVLSTDEDVLVPCQDLALLYNTWELNPLVLVGYSPRLYAYDVISGALRYLNWQHTWWTGSYGVMLTKLCMLHKKYLYLYDKILPQSYTKYVDEVRNGEDLGMAYVVQTQTHAPPVWVRGRVYEIGSADGISSGGTHYDQRSACLQRLQALTGGSLTAAFFPLGYQRVTPLTIANTWALWWDKK